MRAIVAAAAVLLSPSAFAQSVDTFDLAGSTFDGQGTLQVGHPHIGWASSYYTGLAFVYANDPLVQVFEDGTEQAVVSNQLSTRLAAGYNLDAKARLDVEVPVYPWVGTADGNSFAFGDIQVGATVPILAYDLDGVGDDGFGLAIIPRLRLPSGSKAAYVGDGFGASLDAAVGGALGDIGWASNVGVDLSGKEPLADSDLEVGSSFDFGAGASYRLDADYAVGAELDGQVGFGGTGYQTSPVEGHVYTSYGSGEGLGAVLGVGKGLRAGVGAPDFRVILGLSWRDKGAPPDTDGDGLPNATDDCPTSAEDLDGFQDSDGCPEADNDNDGIPDAFDLCGLDPEDVDGWQDQDGCPDPDDDKDGLLDAVDECPREPGSQATGGCPDKDGDTVRDSADQCVDEPGPPALNGCPDGDGDRVPDFRDACPDEAADARIDPRRSDGCPARVFISAKRIEITEMVYFDTGRTSIKSVSFDLLDEIAAILKEHPEIKKIEVAGHTDNVGNDAYNERLSQGRAESVQKYLVDKGGVGADRIVAVGYGEARPVETNDTKEGRELNRRVEFVILEQDGVPEPPKLGPVKRKKDRAEDGPKEVKPERKP